MATAVSSGPIAVSGGVRKVPAKPKQVKVVPRPNEEAFRSREAVHLKAVSELHESIVKITAQMDELREGKSEYENKQRECRQRLDSISRAISELESERVQIHDSLSEHKERSRNKFSEATNMKKRLQYTSEQQLEEEISEIEKYLITSTVSLKNEKELVAKMQRLERLRPQVRSYTLLESAARNSDTTSTTPLRARRDQIQTELTKLREQRQEEMQKIETLRSQRQVSTAPVKDLLEKKQELRQSMGVEQAKLNEIQAEKIAAQSEYSQYLKTLRSWRRNQERMEQRFRELEARRHRAEKALEDMDIEEGSLPGMSLLLQTIAYTRTIVEGADADRDSNPGRGDATPKTTEDSEANAALGGEYEMVVPKAQRDDDFFLAPISKKKNKNKSRRKKQGVNSHNMSILADFENLGVSAPRTTTEAEACLQQLEDKRDKLEAKRSEFQAKTDQRRIDLHAELQRLVDEEKEERKRVLDGENSPAEGASL